MRDSFLVNGVAVKKTFSYAGFEQQAKKFENPKILLLNPELELKSENENAEVRYKIHSSDCVSCTSPSAAWYHCPIVEMLSRSFPMNCSIDLIYLQ